MLNTIKRRLAPVIGALLAAMAIAYAADQTIDGILRLGPSAVIQSPLADAKYTTAAAQSATFAAGDLTGARVVTYDNTGTTPGNLTTRTATQMFGDIPGAYVGMSYILMIRNSSGSANTATIVAGAGVTLTGTMTIAQTVTRVFVVTFTSATAVTIQSMGISAAGA
jgi:hypothetical protein